MFSTEHILICLSILLFPPVLIFVLFVVTISSVIRLLGLRRKYVQCLLKIFKWSAREIRTSVKITKRQSAVNLETSSCSEESSMSDDDDEKVEKRRNPSTEIIKRQGSIDLINDGENNCDSVSCRGWAVINDSLDFIKHGIEVVIQDDVTSRFETEQIATWNMLTRTSVFFYQHINWKVTLIWAAGCIFRYIVLLPIRLLLLMNGLIFMVVGTAALGLLKDGWLKKYLNEKFMLCCYSVLCGSVTAVINFHDEKNRPKESGICVANHTSPIDVAILGTNGVYAYVGQRHTGLLGFMQRALSRASAHVWFERGEEKDRSFVTQKLKEHVNEPKKLPILIFPEGTCINNTSVMMFKKGSFEAATTIYPISMKYDARFGDAFWDSSKQGWLEYLLWMLTSWAIICDVWYLKPLEKLPNEDAVSFASRVKKEIAARGGLVDLEWDGGLKRRRVSQKLINEQQKKYFGRLSRYTSFPGIQQVIPNDHKMQWQTNDKSSINSLITGNTEEIAKTEEKSPKFSFDEGIFDDEPVDKQEIEQAGVIVTE